MSVEFDSQPPQAYLRLCETFPPGGGGPTVAPRLCEVTRVLAASRPGGVFLCLGPGAGETGTWVLGGMDLASRLVVVVQGGDEADTLERVFDGDLRVTVHVQDAVTFLGDVRDHRFDLITDLSPERPTELSRLALARLAPGAFYMARRSTAELKQILLAQDAAAGNHETATDSNSFALAYLPGELDVTLIARGAQKIQAKRRGGRRARQGVTPLFSARPRRADD